MLIWFGKPASESPQKYNKTSTVAIVRCHIFLREVESTPGLDVTEERQGEPCTRACTQRNPQDAAAGLSHSLCAPTLNVCQRNCSASPSAAAGNLKAVFYLKDGGGGGGGGGGVETRISLLWIRTIEMGQREREREREREEGGGEDGGRQRGAFIKLGLTLNYNKSSLPSSSSRHCRVDV